MTLPLLTLIVFTPVVGALMVAVLPREPDAGLRRAALVFSLVPFALSLWMLGRFDPADAGFQFVERASWIPAWGVSYHLGVDGVSLFLVLLTTFLTPIVLLDSWGNIHRRVKDFLVLMLLLEAGMLGALLALDLFLFYVFWEVMLVPMVLLIGVGRAAPRLRGGQVRALHDGGEPPDAGRHRLSRVAREGRRRRHGLRLRALPRARPRRARAARALPRLRARVRHQGAALPVPHLAA
jgi:NADH:ubiquinone oxidoreductase subunit 2 (subunit N)